MSIIDFIIHVDKYLSLIISQYGVWTYGILFLIIFLETGLVVTPFFPGDSLLFVSGMFASSGVLNIWLLFVLFSFAAILGDSVNYFIGRYFGGIFFKNRWFSKESFDKTNNFYKKYGGKTIIFARFIPIIRTFAPFVAGVGKMNYSEFFLYNVIGALSWIIIFLFGGYYLGGFSFFQKNLTLIIFIIIFISIIPPIVEFFRSRK